MTPTQTAKDGYGMVLNYFTGDFKSTAQSIGTTERFADADRLNGNSGVANFNNLYNGNIASWESSYHIRNGINHGGNNSNTFDYTYQFDQLNRIKGSFTKERNSSYGWSNVDNYNTSNSYDANGNIMSMIRLHNSNTFDKLGYNYLTNTNMLHKVTDGITSSAYVGDIEDGQQNFNYEYDPSGNLIKDEQSGIGLLPPDRTLWTVDGKVKKITQPTSQISYLYDGMGNRVMKRVHNSFSGLVYYTIYARDANGQTLAIYERGVSEVEDEEEITITPCLKMSFNPEYATHGCTVDVSICPPLYTYDANTHEITINPPGLSIPLLAWLELMKMFISKGIYKYTFLFQI